MKKTTFALIITVSASLIAGCSTPIRTMKNYKTGQVVTCGGSSTGALIGVAAGGVVGSVVGYHIQKSNDNQCERDYRNLGFKRIHAPEKQKVKSRRNTPAKKSNFSEYK